MLHEISQMCTRISSDVSVPSVYAGT
jgi:hypothetical protein